MIGSKKIRKDNPATAVTYVYAVVDVRAQSVLSTFNAQNDDVAKRSFAYIVSNLPAALRDDAELRNVAWFYNDAHDADVVPVNVAEFESLVAKFDADRKAMMPVAPVPETDDVPDNGDNA